MSEKWIPCHYELPKSGVEVMTKIDDGKGERNVQPLKLHNGLWFLPDLSMYVYYEPTHWHPIANPRRSP